MRTLLSDSVEVKEGQRCLVDAPFGDVTVGSWDRQTADVEITGNQRAAERFELAVTADDAGMIVRATDRHVSPDFGHCRLGFDITVPRSFTLDLRTSGAIHVDNVKGEMRLDTSGGSITLARIEGRMTLATAGGNVDAVDVSGGVDVKTSGGSLTLMGTEGAIVAETSGGNIEVDSRGEQAGIDLRTSGGHIRVTVPPDTRADVDVDSPAAALETDFELDADPDGTRTSTSGQINGGGKVIRCVASGGRIQLLRRRAG